MPQRAFHPTHRIIFGAGEISVMLVLDPRRGIGNGPAYTATEWDRGIGYSWELRDGEWLWQGGPGHHIRVETYPVRET